MSWWHGKPRRKAAVNAAKTRCCRDHPLIETNVYRWTDRYGYAHRSCRTCKSIRESGEL
jgi:hypothetical protein